MMNTFPHLKNPPIVETAFSVAFKHRAFTQEEIFDIVKQIAPGYVKGGDISCSHIACTMGPKPSIVENNGWSGSRFTKDNNLILTLQNVFPPKDEVAFAFSILPPYRSWEDFISNVLPILGGLINVLDHSPVLRVGLRTINRLVASEKICQIGRLLNNYPPSVTSVNGVITNDFVHRESLFFPDQELSATVVRASERCADSNVAVILDSDVFRKSETQLTLEAFESILSKMHDLRNRVFFDAVAEKYLEGCE